LGEWAATIKHAARDHRPFLECGGPTPLWIFLDLGGVAERYKDPKRRRAAAVQEERTAPVSVLDLRRLGDHAQVARQQHLDGHDALPVGVLQDDLAVVLAGLDV